MKFIVSSTDLLSHLQAISRVINNKNSLPILDNFLLQLEGKTLTMTASDIETTLITSMEVEKWPLHHDCYLIRCVSSLNNRLHSILTILIWH